MATKKTTTKVTTQDRNKDLTTPVGVPSYLTPELAEQDDSLVVAEEKQKLARFKVVQDTETGGRGLKKLVGEGGVCLLPSKAPIIQLEDAEKGLPETVEVVPVFLYRDYVTRSDFNDESSKSYLAGPTSDGSSEIARKALDPEKRNESYSVNGENFTMQHLERLCFVVLIDDENHPCDGELGTIVFQSGEHNAGTTWCAGVNSRKVRLADGTKVRAPLYSQRWVLSTAIRPAKKPWYGIDAIPAEQPWVTEEDFPAMQDTYEAMKTYHAKGNLETEEDEAEEGNPNAITDDEAENFTDEEA